MGIITPTNTAVSAFKGVHLYHANLSNCAMRVRMTLEEKSVPWVSHHLDLTKKEHITPEYFGINPNGVVPTLVHDGLVVIESDDIIEYIDNTFPEPPLQPQDTLAREEMLWWMREAVRIQVKAVKTFIYFHKMQGKMRQNDAQRKLYEALQTNPELLAFHRRSSVGALSSQDADKAKSTLDQYFIVADKRLHKKNWLACNQFTLADIAWAPLYFTLKGAGYDVSGFPAVEDWMRRIMSRSSFQRGVLQWSPTF